MPERTEPRTDRATGGSLALFAIVPPLLIWVGLDLWVTYRNGIRGGPASTGFGLWVSGSIAITVAGFLAGTAVHRANPWGGAFQVRKALALGIVPLIVACSWVALVFAPSLILWLGIGVLEILLESGLAAAAWLLVGVAVASGFSELGRDIN